MILGKLLSVLLPSVRIYERIRFNIFTALCEQMRRWIFRRHQFLNVFVRCLTRRFCLGYHLSVNGIWSNIMGLLPAGFHLLFLVGLFTIDCCTFSKADWLEILGKAASLKTVFLITMFTVQEQFL